MPKKIPSARSYTRIAFERRVQARKARDKDLLDYWEEQNITDRKVEEHLAKQRKRLGPVMVIPVVKGKDKVFKIPPHLVAQKRAMDRRRGRRR